MCVKILLYSGGRSKLYVCRMSQVGGMVIIYVYFLLYILGTQ